ncbi:MAG: T9SS type A sorting domain-containing protein, partial [Candidatus Krumholzibacteria bacterium]|nr:T9SS type A sorting domain-containing protein [Candidatus Krumholzibacteria bacterium]
YFTVYGSNTDDFGAATVVDYTVAPTMDVTASPYTYYYVTATDFSGNEGGRGSLNTATGGGGTPLGYVLSVSNYPNPFNPSTTVKYTVPERGLVTVTIYDAQGSWVATLVNHKHEAGAYATQWGGRSDVGAVVSSGVYFARVTQNGTARSKKMILLK